MTGDTNRVIWYSMWYLTLFGVTISFEYFAQQHFANLEAA